MLYIDGFYKSFETLDIITRILLLYYKQIRRGGCFSGAELITMSKTIAISNQKGGVGKTTTCINISAFLAAMGKKVLVVDLDPQGNATSGLGIEKKNIKNNSLFEVLVGDITAEQALKATGVPGLHIIPSSIDLVGADKELMNTESSEKVLRKAIASIKNNYDFLFIDCPPSLSVLTVNALTAADSVMIPMPGEFFSLQGLAQLTNTIRLVKKHLNQALDIEGVVLTIFDGRSNLANSVAEEVAKLFGRKVYETRIPRNVRLGEAPSYGMPIMQYDPRSSGSVAYMMLAEEFLKRNNSKYTPINNIAALKKRI